jgi:hypothetical protein
MSFFDLNDDVKSIIAEHLIIDKVINKQFMTKPDDDLQKKSFHEVKVMHTYTHTHAHTHTHTQGSARAHRDRGGIPRAPARRLDFLGVGHRGWVRRLGSQVYTHTHTHTHVCLHICTYTHICVFTCLYTYIYLDMYMCIQLCT